jgi:probable F420-dependent oxidoreductase
MEFWCSTAFMNTDELPAVAAMLDETGYDGMVVSDHLMYPKQLNTPYYTDSGRPFWEPETAWPDPWVLIGAMAAVTTRLKFSNAVYVAAARPLLEVAKKIGTAACLSRGRVQLAVGAGWMKEEFDVMGQEFGNRGARLDEMIQALRALWAGGWVSWNGTHYQVPEMMIEPHPPGPVPILCGGYADIASRRAARLCDGFVSAQVTWDEATARICRINELRRQYGRANEPFQIIMAIQDKITPNMVKRAEDLGVTGLMCSPWSDLFDGVLAGDFSGLRQPAERFRAPIESFAETVLATAR